MHRLRNFECISISNQDPIRICRFNREIHRRDVAHLGYSPSTIGYTRNLVTTRSFNCFSHRMIFVRTWLPGYESTAPVADIMGPREQRVPSGSTITLRCVILSPYQTRPIRGVQWLRDNKLLTFQVMQPQLDTRDRSNEISVWRPRIEKDERKKGALVYHHTRREGMWIIWCP